MRSPLVLEALDEVQDQAPSLAPIAASGSSTSSIFASE